jgi:hypothetical protein
MGLFAFDLPYDHLSPCTGAMVYFLSIIFEWLLLEWYEIVNPLLKIWTDQIIA